MNTMQFLLKTPLRAAAVLLFVLPLTACVTVPVPVSAVTVPQLLGTSNGASPVSVTPSWWEDFGDQDLNRLVQEAVAANRDLKTAIARVKESRALSRVMASSLYPSLDASATAGRSKASLPPGFPAANLFQGGASATWEADVFGGNRAQLSRAGYELQSSVGSANGAYLLVTTETVRRYLELAGLERRLTLLRSAIDVQQKTLDLTSSRYTAGLSSRFDIERAQAQLDATEAQIPEVESAGVATRKLLAVLLGRTLQNAPAVPAQSFDVKALPAQVPGVVLMGRPDIAVADANLRAQAQALKAARLQWFPHFVFNLDGGRAHVESQGRASLTSTVFGAQLGITTPIFDAGRIRFNIAANEARLDAASARYEGALLAAISDVDASYRSYALLQERVARLGSARDSARQAAQSARALYEAGAIDLLSVLIAEGQAVASEDQWVQAHSMAPVAYVDVIRAFGGSPSDAEHWLAVAGIPSK